MSTPPAARLERKVFLRARRADLSPEAVGLARGTRRLARGLRREEVAALANVGVTWYTWLEQGRDINVSRETLSRIAKALRLSVSDEAYLFALSGYAGSHSRADAAVIDASYALALNAIGSCPAMIVNSRFDVIASNPLAHAIFEPEPYSGPFSQNMFWRAYMDPVRRHLYIDWEERMTSSLGMLRVNYASRIGDPRFEELLEALRSKSAEFARQWDTAHAEPLTPSRIRMESRPFGRLTVWSTRFAIPERPGFLMLVYVPADASTQSKLSFELPATTGQARSKANGEIHDPPSVD